MSPACPAFASSSPCPCWDRSLVRRSSNARRRRSGSPWTRTMRPSRPSPGRSARTRPLPRYPAIRKPAHVANDAHDDERLRRQRRFVHAGAFPSRGSGSRRSTWPTASPFGQICRAVASDTTATAAFALASAVREDAASQHADAEHAEVLRRDKPIGDRRPAGCRGLSPKAGDPTRPRPTQRLRPRGRDRR